MNVRIDWWRRLALSGALGWMLMLTACAATEPPSMSVTIRPITTQVFTLSGDADAPVEGCARLAGDLRRYEQCLDRNRPRRPSRTAR